MNQDFKNNGAWQKMMDVAKDKSVVSHHSVYTPVPYKLSRCIGLKAGEKAVLLDIINYMGNNMKCYPNIEAIALNCNMVHTTVENHIKSLEQKQFLIVHRRHSNTYYLKGDIEANPYIVLSEILHKIRFLMKDNRSEDERSQIDRIRKIAKSDLYNEAIEMLLYIYDLRLSHMRGADSWLEMYKDTLIKFIDSVYGELKVNFLFAHMLNSKDEFYKQVLDIE